MAKVRASKIDSRVLPTAELRDAVVVAWLFALDVVEMDEVEDDAGAKVLLTVWVIAVPLDGSRMLRVVQDAEPLGQVPERRRPLSSGPVGPS